MSAIQALLFPEKVAHSHRWAIICMLFFPLIVAAQGWETSRLSRVDSMAEPLSRELQPWPVPDRIIRMEEPEAVELFKNHKDGYPVFRIPALVVSNTGRILAFAEGRKSLMDHGNIDLVMRSSDDMGNTWSTVKVVWEDGKNTCGNPVPIVDRSTGAIIVLVTLNNDKVMVLRSEDDGTTWDGPDDITKAVKHDSWKWYATGPGHGIQLEPDTHEGRLVVPCNHTVEGADEHISHAIFSDDGGRTWSLGNSVPQGNTDECTVVEQANGELLLNMRNKDGELPNRLTSRSSDGGYTWTTPRFDSTLVDPVCQGSLIRYSHYPDVLLFSNNKHRSQRRNLTLSMSLDGGNSWPGTITVNERRSAYSDLVVLPDGDVLCLFEKGWLLPYGGIWIARIQRASLLQLVGANASTAR